jgi:hypothetical protein
MEVFGQFRQGYRQKVHLLVQKGAHVWIFFEQPIPASLARKMGAAILTRTMEQWHHVGLDS